MTSSPSYGQEGVCPGYMDPPLNGMLDFKFHNIFIQPLSVAMPFASAGAPIISFSVIFFRAKRKARGINAAAAFIQQTNVTFLPLSALVIFATLFTP